VRALLADAADYAKSEGARGLGNEIEALARRARLDLSSDAVTAPAGDEEPTPAESAGLTPREAEVLSLVAEGRTNRQIAATLFISDKTASVHVSRILAKLGATNRGEAAAIARRLGV
jgi:DNA-binding NarL/FixJ family response regulator